MKRIDDILTELASIGIRGLVAANGKSIMVDDCRRALAHAFGVGKSNGLGSSHQDASEKPVDSRCNNIKTKDKPNTSVTLDRHEMVFSRTVESLTTLDLAYTTSPTQIDPKNLPLCDRCGGYCDVQTIDEAWHCSHCNPRADAKKQQIQTLLQVCEDVVRLHRERVFF